MAVKRYGYKYATIGDISNGLCLGVLDTTNYILRPDYIPVEDIDAGYELKYYWPLPVTVTSFSDFQGQWYTNAEHTILADGLN